MIKRLLPSLLVLTTLWLLTACSTEHGAVTETVSSTSTTPSQHAVDHEKKPMRYSVITIDFERVETPFMIGLWIFCSSIAKIGFHMSPKLNQMFPESCLLIAVGVLIGIFLYMASSLHVQPLTPNTFFLYMLPPIILDAGYFMPNRLFFGHLGTILMFAVLGTIFNTLTIGLSLWGVGMTGLFGCEVPLLDILLFSALISAVDPVAVLAVFEEIHVNEILYIVVFGESLLNDAVTVVLYHMFESYSQMGVSNMLPIDLASGVASFFVVAVGGTFVGVFWGFLTGLVTRYTYQVRVIEPIFIFVMAYLAYLSAEIFHWSGILAITFCGITMKNYVEANISQKSHTTIKYAMKMLSSSSETIIFMFLGVSTVSDKHDWNTWFVVLTITFCSVYRTIGVVLLTALVNRFRLIKLSVVDTFVMSYGGLRGAVAFALVLLIDPSHIHLQPMFVTTTIAVIYFTVFFQGITIKPLVKALNVKRAEKRKPTMNERIHERLIDHMMAGIEDILGHHGNHRLRDKFRRFDNQFIRPLLIKDHQGAEPKILETYSKLAMKDAIEYMRRNASAVGAISNTESMSAIFRNYTSANLSGSYTQLENSTWNIDLQELEYNPSKKDLTDAKIHHLLAEELCQPYRRHRRLSYSRHAVDDRDLSNPVNYRTYVNIRRMVGDQRRHHHKRSKRLKDNKNHVSFPGVQQNGMTKQFTHDYLDEVLQENDETEAAEKPDDWEAGITFTAHPQNETEPGGSPSGKKNSKDSTGAEAVGRVTTPTALEKMLPWKREDEDSALKQSEFPAWCSNKDYLAYNSPSNTFLGGIIESARRSVIGLFRRESGSGESLSLPGPLFESVPLNNQPAQDSNQKNQEMPSRSQQPQWRHKIYNRRGSLLECSSDPIQEEKIQIGEGTSTGTRGSKWGKSWGRGVRQHSLPAGCAIDSAGSTPPSSPEPEDRLMKYPQPRRQASRSESEVVRRSSDPRQGYIELKHQDSNRSTQSADRQDSSRSAPSVDLKHQDSNRSTHSVDFKLLESRSNDLRHQESKSADLRSLDNKQEHRYQDSRSTDLRQLDYNRSDSRSSDMRQDSRSSDNRNNDIRQLDYRPDSRSSDIRQDSRSSDIRQDSRSSDIRQDSRSSDQRQDSRSSDHRQDSRNDLRQDSRSSDRQIQSRSDSRQDSRGSEHRQDLIQDRSADHSQEIRSDPKSPEVQTKGERNT